MDKMNTHEMISALADGQLQGIEFAQAVQAVTGDDEALATWHAYHLIGDVLRSGELAASSSPAAFVARLQERLSAEVPVSVAETVVRPVVVGAQPAANDGSFRWKLLAGFASLAAVAAIVWNTAGGLGGNGQAELAKAGPAQPPQQAVAAAGAEGQVMIRDSRLDELLAAHRQFGGNSALQMPAGFLRNATYEGPAR